MTELVSPVTFTPCQLGRETVYLGDKIIGCIVSHAGSATSRATAMIFLPDVPRKQQQAPSFERAREIVQREVEEWVRAAGLVSAQRERRRA